MSAIRRQIPIGYQQSDRIRELRRLFYFYFLLRFANIFITPLLDFYYITSQGSSVCQIVNKKIGAMPYDFCSTATAATFFALASWVVAIFCRISFFERLRM